MREVRRYRQDDVRDLLEIVNSVESGGLLSEMQLVHHLRRNDNIGGRTWIILKDGVIRGYASLIPVPALPGVFDLAGGIAPQCQRQGLGSFLLKQLLKEIPHGDVQTVTHAVNSLNSPAALFLTVNGFRTEHIEWQMVLNDPSALSLDDVETGTYLQMLPRQAAAELFLSLYEASFSGTPWYQPYQNAEEVLEDMGEEDSILILQDNGNAVGFIWLRWIGDGIVEFEPLGIIKNRQNEGLGRTLLGKGIEFAKKRGARELSLSVWSSNDNAIHLYRDLGFIHNRTTTYLGLEVRLT